MLLPTNRHTLTVASALSEESLIKIIEDIHGEKNIRDASASPNLKLQVNEKDTLSVSLGAEIKPETQEIKIHIDLNSPFSFPNNEAVRLLEEIALITGGTITNGKDDIVSTITSEVSPSSITGVSYQEEIEILVNDFISYVIPPLNENAESLLSKSTTQHYDALFDAASSDLEHILIKSFPDPEHTSTFTP